MWRIFPLARYSFIDIEQFILKDRATARCQV